jgi:hypothetical protein
MSDICACGLCSAGFSFRQNEKTVVKSGYIMFLWKDSDIKEFKNPVP